MKYDKKLLAEKKNKHFIPMNLQLFAEGGDGGDTDPNNDGGDNSGDGGEDKTFNQDDINSIVKKEKGKAKKAAQKELLETLGLESVDDLQSIVNAKKKADEQKKTDLEKKEEEINGLKTEKQKAIEKANKIAITAEFKVKATDEKFGLKGKQIDAALKLADLSEIEVGEEGAVTGIEDALEKVVKDYPFLKGGTGDNIGGGAGGNPGGDGTGKSGKSSIGQRLAERRKKSKVEQGKNPYFS